MINPVTFSGIPVFGSGAAKVTPPSPAPYINGYLAGDILPAQHLNWFMANLTSDDSLSGTALNKVIAELDNLVTGSGGTVAPGDDTQVLTAILTRRTYATSQTPTALKGHEFWTVTAAGATTQDFSAGAATAGTSLEIANTGAGACTVRFVAGVTTLVLAQYQSIKVSWDGATWWKVGGSIFKIILTSGTGATWVCPFTGVFNVTAVGGGGGGGGGKVTTAGGAAAGGGGGGGGLIYTYKEIMGTSYTYTVGAAGTGGDGTPNNGVAGGNTLITDGVTALTAGGGAYGYLANASNAWAVANGGVGGVVSGSPDIRMDGGGGGRGMLIDKDIGGGMTIGGSGGGSYLASPQLKSDVGVAAASIGFGGGGQGANQINVGSRSGANGTSGIIIIEY